METKNTKKTSSIIKKMVADKQLVEEYFNGKIDLIGLEKKGISFVNPLSNNTK
jgi:hypothetical protein